ncbi:uncharacterized protein YyaL (SSP411 family) [Janthinobacterium lividum]|uniref:hypothetical protein n=1 Tax=Janthinobacterium lividum TaxID=29581 RepID=UPI003D216E5A
MKAVAAIAAVTVVAGLYFALPALSRAAERKARLAGELARQKRFLKDMYRLQDETTGESADGAYQLRYLIDEYEKTITYLETFSACSGTLAACDRQAAAAARAP